MKPGRTVSPWGTVERLEIGVELRTEPRVCAVTTVPGTCDPAGSCPRPFAVPGTRALQVMGVGNFLAV